MDDAVRMVAIEVFDGRRTGLAFEDRSVFRSSWLTQF